MSKVRMNVELSREVADFLEEVAEEEETTKTEMVRRALSVLKAYKKQRERGRGHIGFTSHPENLEAEILGILDR